MVFWLKLSLFVVVLQGAHVSEEESSLLQVAKQRSRVKDPLPEPNPLDVCDNSVRLVLDQPVVNNLGTITEGQMKFENVLRDQGVEGIDLIIENQTVYTPSNAAANKLNGHFVQVNMWCGQTHTFKMKLVNSDGELHPLNEFTVSVYDVDEGVLANGDPQGRESVRVCGGVSPEVSHPNTLDIVYGDDGGDSISVVPKGCVEVTSTTSGNAADNPSSTILNEIQSGRTVDFPFHNSAEATMTFSLTPCAEGRNLFFAFEPSVSCYVAEQEHPICVEHVDCNYPNSLTPPEPYSALHCTGWDPSSCDEPTCCLSNYWYWKFHDEGIGIEDIRKISKHNDEWYFNGQPACVGYGTWNEQCPSSRLVCETYWLRRGEFGKANNQAARLKKAIDSGGVHPDCPGGSGELSNYWFWRFHDAGVAVEDIMKITQDDDEWLYNGNPSCVGAGTYNELCPSDRLVCETFWYRRGQFGMGVLQGARLKKAIENGGVHPDCPGGR